MDAIAAAGDATVRSFGALCMALIQSNGEVTAEDAHDFASSRNLL